MKAMTRIMLVSASLFAMGALAHGGVEHLKGTITKVEGTSITLAVEQGPPVVVATDGKTEISREGVKVTFQDISVGAKAVIHAVKHENHLLAQVVKLAPAAPTNAAPDAGTGRKP